MGLINFGTVRERMRVKENKIPSQGATFIETRKGSKGKQLDIAETENKISKPQESIENNEEMM